jgi:hypothetical protein
VHELATPEQRALSCVICAAVHAQLHGKRRRTVQVVVEQHWRGHVPAAIHKQLLNADWVLTADELVDVQAWRPEYRPIQRVPFSANSTVESRWRRDQVLADNELAGQCNQVEASTAAARRLVLKRLEKLTTRANNHAAAECSAKAKSTGRPCRRLAMPGKKRCRLHGGLGGRQTDEGRARIAAYQRQRWARWRQARADAA